MIAGTDCGVGEKFDRATTPTESIDRDDVRIRSSTYDGRRDEATH